MDIKKSINRIAWRFGSNGNKNPFPVNQNDIDAFNEIVRVVKDHQKQQFKQNELFAKLYIFLYMRIIAKHQATVMDTLPRKELYRVLERPIEHLIEMFRNEMNDSDMYASFDKVGIDLKHPAQVSAEEKASNLEKMKNFKHSEIWDYETTKECLEIEINNALNLNK